MNLASEGLSVKIFTWKLKMVLKVTFTVITVFSISAYCWIKLKISFVRGPC